MTKEEIYSYIKENYPNIKVNNQYFFDEKALRDFSLETIINILSKLSKEEAFPLYMNLYSFGNAKWTIDMIKYIIRDNPIYIQGEDKSKYATDKIVREYARLYSNKEHTLDELQFIQKLNIQNNQVDNKEFYHFDINFYNELIIIQKLYKEGKIKYNDILPFIEQVANKLKENIIKTEENYDNKYDNYINEIISHLLLGNIKPEDFFNSSNSYHKVRNLITVSKLGTTIFKFENTPIEVLSAIKGKQILNIYNLFINIPNLERIKKNYSKEDLLVVFTNMSLLLGYDNTNNIIRHLPQDYLKVTRLFYSFLNIDLTNIKIENKNVIYNKDLIKLFIGNNLEEPNNLLNLIFEGKTNLNDKIETLYAYWDILEERFKMQPLKTRLAFLEEVLNINKVILNPDEYLLEGDILNGYYDNRKFQHMQSINLIKQIREEYRKMKHNYQKTIPYVSGSYEGYTYETLKANDPNLFALGSASDCCFKMGGDAESFVKYCAENPNGRVLAIKNSKGKIVAMVPMVRNGNLVLCNSIESTMIRNKEFMKKMFDILEEVGNKMIKISSLVESTQDRIHVMLISDYKNEIEDFNKYKSVEYGEIEVKCLLPLDKSIYVNMGGFDYKNYIVSQIPNLDYTILRSFEPSTLYYDPRSEILEIEIEYINDKKKKQINSIYYEQNKRLPNYDNILKIILGDDWVILINKQYKIESIFVSKDKRAEEEYTEYLELAKEHCNYYNEDGTIKESAYYSYITKK